MNDIKLYSSLIERSFSSQQTVHQCADQLSRLGFDADKTVHSIKDIMLETAWKGNENIRNQDFLLEFVLVMGGVNPPGKRALVLLVAVIDSAMDGKKLQGKDPSLILRSLNSRMQTEFRHS